MGQYTPGFPLEPPTLLVVGHASRDLVDDDPRGWRLGGSVSYVSLTAARMGIHVQALMGLDGESATAHELELFRAAGVDVRPLVFPEAPVFRNVETPSGRRQECLAVGPRLDTDDVPGAWRDAPAWAFVPVLGEVSGERWARLPDRVALVALGWQGFLREPTASAPTRARAPRPDALLERADLTIASEDDLEASGANWDAASSSERIAHLFPRPGQEVVLTDAELGGRLFRRTADGWETLRYPAAPARVAEATGAGDVFLGAFLATALDPSLIDPEGSAIEEGIVRTGRLRVAAVAGAMVTEGPGLTAIPTRRALLARLAGPG